ncbi:MAG: SPFH domain-containing protein [Bdellovibrionales bacterium]|nr:SPFH domain-containing protein [Bdellovibrionales bacterium]
MSEVFTWLATNWWLVLIGLVALWYLLGFRKVGSADVGLVEYMISFKSNETEQAVVESGAGYRMQLKTPGWRWAPFLVARIRTFPMVQVPPGEVGIVYAQIGESLPQGFRTAEYLPEMKDFTNPRTFLEKGGQKGIQRPVLRPGAVLPIHPVAFLVITSEKVYGLPIDPALQGKRVTPASFGVKRAESLQQTIIEPKVVEVDDPVTGQRVRQHTEMIGVVTSHEGPPIDGGEIAGRLGGWQDLQEAYDDDKSPEAIIELLLTPKNGKHENYQDFQQFIAAGGRVGLQHDVLLPGAYNINPICAVVEQVPMLTVEQGQVAVIKSYAGLPTADTSGEAFKYGSLVRPGHRGIWNTALTTGKYAINPRLYHPIIVPTSIINLNWADATSNAHRLDADLKPIEAKSKEGFVFMIDLEVQIHISANKAPMVISMVGTIENLINEVLQGAVGNYFRDTLASKEAVEFIEQRQKVQKDAEEHIRAKLADYHVETPGVYIQDVKLPADLVKVLQEREIAKQQKATYAMQQESEQQRVATEAARGEADMQADLARSKVGITIQANKTDARKLQAAGDAEYVTLTGQAKGAEVLAIGEAKAKGYKAQVAALGRNSTTLVNVITALGEAGLDIVPDVLVNGGGEGNGGGGNMAVLGLVTKLLNDHRDDDDDDGKPEKRKQTRRTRSNGKGGDASGDSPRTDALTDAQTDDDDEALTDPDEDTSGEEERS